MRKITERIKKSPYNQERNDLPNNSLQPLPQDRNDISNTANTSDDEIIYI